MNAKLYSFTKYRFRFANSMNARIESELNKLSDSLARIEEIVVTDLDNHNIDGKEMDKVADMMSLYRLPFSYTKLTSDHIMIDRLIELDKDYNIIAIDDSSVDPIHLSVYLYNLSVELNYLETTDKDMARSYEKYNKDMLGI